MKASGAGSRRGGRVLLVDDDPAYGEYVRRVLSSGGFEVSHQPDAESALVRVRAERWDLLVTDIQLPGMSGLELLERGREEVPGLPVAVLTRSASAHRGVAAPRGPAAEPAAGSGAEPPVAGKDRGGPLPRPRPAAGPTARVRGADARAGSGLH